MSSWNIIDNCDGTFTLLNDTQTLVRKHKQISTEKIIEIFTKMEELDVPISYSDGVEEIYFTYLKYGLSGDYSYWIDSIRISCNNGIDPCSTLIHELGHHMDFRNDLADKDVIKEEWIRLSGSFERENVSIKHDGDEYFAECFEKYYTNRKKIKNDHPVLFKYMKKIHNKFSFGGKNEG